MTTATPDPSTAQPPRVGRRQTLHAVGVAGVAVTGAGLLAGCGSDDVEQAASSAAGAASSAASAAGSAASDLVEAAQIPVGGGKVFEAIQAVVTQPTDGDYKAFSSVCTHSGCQVDSVENGVIECPCHGSQFDISTGEVRQGPATDPLPEKSVSVDGDGITVT
ncbi:Rieske (2Fe-2S) protein [Phycicoccus endophyticus]|uniref:Cytochrome bc1 complex Rieske iron-sulfur subunit n=1 Tax=Phycicoccus endophyticus TaxID=1690220 RepID=A0A7G9R4D1_9MICO|nr:Rieske (2Fe-2S) protein [Phycicoccus endophyticus]NHI18325.1 Rieske (2Fe-2S) protein [Phycicoccus endophyticus]QNN50456.1 Rieske (2Fe-2S) protein [Phycicoccus endophyticus]GGL24662.1 iron-sulfur protein [Phycicoccus endophyticus]